MYLEFSPDRYELNTVAHLPTPARELAFLHAADVCSEKVSFPSIVTPNPSDIKQLVLAFLLGGECDQYGINIIIINIRGQIENRPLQNTGSAGC